MRPHHIDESKNLDDVGDGVFVGTYRACNDVGHEFPRAIHIGRNRDGCDRCKTILTGSGNGLIISWREEEGLDRLSVPIGEIMEYAKEAGDLLVHCKAGVCRSALIALACKAARGRDVWQGIADVNRGQWECRRHVAAWNPKTLRELIRYLETL